MAKRPNVKDILEAARKAGAAKPAGESGSTPEPEAVESDAPVEEIAASGSPEPAADVPTAESLGRPLTLKEKLAAARATGRVEARPGGQARQTRRGRPGVCGRRGRRGCCRGGRGRPRTAQAHGSPDDPGREAGGRQGRGQARRHPAAKPAAAKAGAAPAAKAAAARELPPLDKMTDPKDLAEAARQAAARRAKEEQAAKAAASPPKAKPAPAKPQTVPPRPSRALADAGAAPMAGVSRRGFFVGGLLVPWIAVAWTTFTAGLIAMTQMTVRFMFPNVLAEPPTTVKIGLPTNYDPEEVNDRFKAEWGFWVVRSTKYDGQDVLYALQSICTHLGCPPNWLASEQKFKCPCHGSGFYISGINFEGPAPRPLERFKVVIADDGQIIVDKSQRFQQELGQWSDPDSFIPA